METWMIWALISVITWWIYHFTTKVIAERNYNTNVANCIWYITGTLIMLGVVLLQWNYDFSKETFFFIMIVALWNVALYSTSIITRVEAMRSIDTVIFYPIYKTFWPIFVTAISFFFFWETLTIKEIIWIIVWICVPLLLITKKENSMQKNLFLWVILIFITAVLSAISSSAPKIIQVRELDINVFLLIVFFFWIFFSYFLYKWEKVFLHKKKRDYSKKGLMRFWIFSGVIHILWFYAFTRALEWNLAVVFTINSFAILIPIILSIIFYWEHFNLKKGIVIALSIISILLFI